MNHEFVNDISYAERIADSIEALEKDVIDVEEIQNLVEIELMKSQYKNVAKDYILYREKRNIARGRKTYEMYMGIVNTMFGVILVAIAFRLPGSSFIIRNFNGVKKSYKHTNLIDFSADSSVSFICSFLFFFSFLRITIYLILFFLFCFQFF